MWKLVGPLVSVHRLVLFFSDVYRFPGPRVHSAAFFVPCIVRFVENLPRIYNQMSLNRDSLLLR